MDCVDYFKDYILQTYDGWIVSITLRITYYKPLMDGLCRLLYGLHITNP